MVIRRGKAVAGEEFSDPLRRFPGRAVDDRPGEALPGKGSFENRNDVAQLAMLAGRDDFEGEVMANSAAIDERELDIEPFAEVIEDVANDTGLGGGSETQDRRWRRIA